MKRFLKPVSTKLQQADGRTLVKNSLARTELEQYKTYEYDSFNKATKVIVEDYTKGSKEVHIQRNYYNAENLRYGIEKDGERTNFVTNGWSVFTELDAEWKPKKRLVVVEDYLSRNTLQNREVFCEQGDNGKTVHIQRNFYDAKKLRYGIEEDRERTNFVTNGWSVFAELDAEWKPTKRLVRGYGIVASEEIDRSAEREPKPFAEIQNQKLAEKYHFYHQNDHGDTEYITGSKEEVTNAYTYDAFGTIINSSELVKNRYTYNGEQYDQISQQYYLRARNYNPLVGRFTQEDVYRGDGLNLYAYCGNNPVMYVDPSGYTKCKKGKDVKPTKSNGADTLPENIVKRGVTPSEAKSIERGEGIKKPTPAHKTTATQHVGGTKHSRDPYTSTTRSNDTANYYATHDNSGNRMENANPVITIDLNKIDSENIIDVSTPSKAKEVLTTPFTQHAAAADQEVLIKGDIPPDAIINFEK